MKHILVLSTLLLIFNGCTQEHKVVHRLDCVLNSVIYNQTGKEVNFKKEDAIKNGYVYYFSVYDDGLLVVNDVDVYVKDKDNERSYSLQIDSKISNNMKYRFTEVFDDVRFLMLNKDIEYSFTCVQMGVE